MQFRHPELLYALILLLIPLIVHLFQLRRFKKIPFTNVAFLKQVELKTRKSSQIKKWLTLLLRTLALACIIVAFTQPYFSAQQDDSVKEEVVLYLDNSFSMQAKGSQGGLLQRGIQDIYEFGAINESLSWFTNNAVYNATSTAELQEEVLEITPSYNQLSLDEVLLRADQLFSDATNTAKRLVLISDLQQHTNKPFNAPANLQIDGVNMRAINRANISIDTAYVNAPSRGNAELVVGLSAQVNQDLGYPVSFYSNSELLAKSAVNFKDNRAQEVSFPLALDSEFQGSVQINDEQLQFDNTLYFNIGKPQRIKVAAVNQGDGTFLQKLYPDSEFEFTAYNSNAVDYNQLLSNNVIVLNELTTVPTALQNALSTYILEGGSLVIIPAADASLDSYNRLLGLLQFGRLGTLQRFERNIATIEFGHPLYTDVFDKNVTNFQYPQVQSFYSYSGNSNSALLLDGGTPFLTQKGNVFLFTAALNQQNANFTSSPLIVPTFYNIARFSLPLPKLYYELGRENTIGIPAKLGQEDIVSIKESTQEWIPLQQAFANNVVLTTSDLPPYSGTFSLQTKQDSLGYLSYNYPRRENANQFYTNTNLVGINWYDSVPELFTAIADQRSVTDYWKWFAMGAVLFLLLEMTVLRFFDS